jgi:hypothetical protein
MPKFILSALPGLLVGLIVGFGVARVGQGGDSEALAESEKKIAKLCMIEAKKVLASSERASRERGPMLRPERSSKPEAGSDDASDRAERSIEATLKRARKEKRWTVANGKMAERLFPRLSTEDAAELSKEILGAVESGELSAEADAWLPEKK